MKKVYKDAECQTHALDNKIVAIVGYGSQGHAHALNLKESGVNVIVALYEGSKSRAIAEKAGLTVMTTAEATKAADVIMILINDEKQADMYEKDILPNLSEGKALAFAHGFSIHFQRIIPPANIDVFMIAPKGPGHTVRSEYQIGRGVPCLFAVYQDYTGNCRDTAFAYGHGIGGGRAGLLETTFREETETDLFGEQAVLCGLTRMRYSISDTAEYGDYCIGKRIITAETKKEMKKVLAEIQDGTFARNWILENQCGRLNFNARRRLESEHPIEKVGKELRALMSWNEPNS